MFSFFHVFCTGWSYCDWGLLPFHSHPMLSALCHFFYDGWNRLVGSCAPTFSIACFYRGGVVSTSGGVSSMVGFRGKRFSVVSFQRHGRGCVNICVGVVVCVMFFVSYNFFFPRVLYRMIICGWMMFQPVRVCVAKDTARSQHTLSRAWFVIPPLRPTPPSSVRATYMTAGIRILQMDNDGGMDGKAKRVKKKKGFPFYNTTHTQIDPPSPPVCSTECTINHPNGKNDQHAPSKRLVLSPECTHGHQHTTRNTVQDKPCIGPTDRE